VNVNDEDIDFLEMLKGVRARVEKKTHIDAKRLFIDEVVPLLRALHTQHVAATEAAESDIEMIFEELGLDENDSSFIDDTVAFVGTFAALLNTVLVAAKFFNNENGNLLPAPDAPPEVMNSVAQFSQSYIAWAERANALQARMGELEEGDDGDEDDGDDVSPEAEGLHAE
jgi:hypothetical protein